MTSILWHINRVSSLDKNLAEAPMGGAIIWLYNAHSVTGHCAWLIRDIICKLNVGRTCVPTLLLL